MGQLFESLKGRPPFIFELIGENGRSLTVAYSDSVGAVQHAASDGRPPYLMAVNEDSLDDEAVVEFLAGGNADAHPRPILFAHPARIGHRAGVCCDGGTIDRDYVA